LKIKKYLAKYLSKHFLSGVFLKNVSFSMCFFGANVYIKQPLRACRECTPPPTELCRRGVCVVFFMPHPWLWLWAEAVGTRVKAASAARNTENLYIIFASFRAN
jgi:hypothetical protein